MAHQAADRLASELEVEVDVNVFRTVGHAANQAR